MKLIELLEILTMGGEGIKIYGNGMAIDECLILECTTISQLLKYKYLHNKKVFQLITRDYDGYIVIILE